MRALIITLIIISLIGVMAAQAQAMTGREFLSLPMARDKLAEVRRHLVDFEQTGYRNLPDPYRLTARMEMLVIDNGWYDRWLDFVSRQAALQLGMHR